MGSPPWRYRSTVEPLTTTMSSLPSLSQSNTPTPPLMDSITYRLSLDEMWGTVSPARVPISCKMGTGVNAGIETPLCDADLGPDFEECGTSVSRDWHDATVTGIYKVKKDSSLARGWSTTDCTPVARHTRPRLR